MKKIPFKNALLLSILAFLLAAAPAIFPKQASAAGTCTPIGDTNTYTCDPPANPPPTGCTILNNGVMACGTIPSGYAQSNVHPATLVSFKAPASLNKNVTANITWETKYAAGCSINGTSVSTSGSMPVGPLTGDKTFVLSCQDTDEVGSPAGTAKVIGSVTIKYVDVTVGSCSIPANNDAVAYDNSKGGYNYYVCSGTSAPPGCSAAGPLNTYTCPRIPVSGYTSPALKVSVTATPSSGVAGSINPTVTWAAQNVVTDPVSCTGDGVVNGGPASGSVTMGVIKTVALQTYAITCTSASGATGSGSATVNVTTPPLTDPNANKPDPCQDTMGNGQLGYCPLEPLVPGLSNTDINFAEFLNNLFKILLIAGALFAVLMIVVAGISYIVAGAGMEIAAAKQRMWAAIYGLLILLGAWLMLYTVNPTLLNFNIDKIGTTAPSNNNPSGSSGAASQSSLPTSSPCAAGQTSHNDSKGGVTCN